VSYYRWKSEIRARGSGILQAVLEPFAPDWSRIDLWSCSPLRRQIPLLRFRYPATAPMPDLIFSSSGWEPYSSRLRSLLRSAGATFEEFPCQLLERSTGRILSGDYAVVHFYECHECLDWVESGYDAQIGADAKPYPSSITRLVLTAACLERAYPIFRLTEARNVVLVHDSVRALLTQHRVRGVRYLPLEEPIGL